MASISTVPMTAQPGAGPAARSGKLMRRGGARRHHTPYAWLGAAALSAGVWATMAGGAGVAQADSSGADSAPAAAYGSRGASASANTGVARRPSSAAASRVTHQTQLPPVSLVGPHPAAAASRGGALLVAPATVDAVRPAASALGRSSSAALDPAVAPARPELGGASQTASPAATISTGGPVHPVAGAAVATPRAAAFCGFSSVTARRNTRMPACFWATATPGPATAACAQAGPAPAAPAA